MQNRGFQSQLCTHAFAMFKLGIFSLSISYRNAISGAETVLQVIQEENRQNIGTSFRRCANITTERGLHSKGNQTYYLHRHIAEAKYSHTWSAL